jgi:hypothetical protein
VKRERRLAVQAEAVFAQVGAASTTVTKTITLKAP